MFNRSPLRIVVALSFAISALGLAAGPASAFYENQNTGSTDSYEVFEPSVICRAENNPGLMDDELNFVKVKKIMNVHHPSSNLRKVGVRVIIQRNTPPHSDNTFVDYHRFPWVYKNADNNANPANFGPWTYYVPENTPDRWRARLLISYYDTSGNVIGTVRGVFEVYRHTNPDGSAPYDIGQDFMDGSNIGYCRREFH